MSLRLGRLALLSAPFLVAGCRSEPLSGQAANQGGASPVSTSSAAGQPSAQPGAACVVPGWRALARMPVECGGLCVPNDVTVSAPPVVWEPRPAYCLGCLGLATPWATSEEQRQSAVASTVLAVGSKPDMFALGFNAPISAFVVFDSAAQPLAAIRTNYEQQVPCGRVDGLALTPTSVGVNFMRGVADDRELLVEPLSDVARVMSDAGVTLRWPKSLVAGVGINEMWLSSELAAIDLSGDLLIGQLKTGDITRASRLPGAPTGQLARARLNGAAAFVARWTGSGSDWWLVRGQEIAPFLGDASDDIDDLATDGQVLVWKRGTEPVAAPLGSPRPVIYQRYDLMTAAYTEDPSQLKPQLLLPNIPKTLGYLRLANGYVTGTYYIPSVTPQRAGALVVRLADGEARESELSSEMNWGFGVFSTATEIWGAVTASPLVRFETYARAPYASMRVVQTGR